MLKDTAKLTLTLTKFAAVAVLASQVRWDHQGLTVQMDMMDHLEEMVLQAETLIH